MIIISGCATLESPVQSGMSKDSFCRAKNAGGFVAICNKKFFYFKNGIEVLNKGSEYAIFKNVTTPTLGDSGFSVRYGNGTYYTSVYTWDQAQEIIRKLDPTLSVKKEEKPKKEKPKEKKPKDENEIVLRI